MVRNSAGVLFAGSNLTMYRSSDGGDTWSQHGLGDAAFALFDELILDADENLIAGTYREGVIRSSDGGDTWLHSNMGLAVSDVVALARSSRGDIVAATSGGVFRTTDDGQTWTRTIDGLPSVNIEAITIDTGDKIYAALNSRGLFHSEDDGASWLPVDASLASQTVASVAVAPNGDVYAGDGEGRIFKSSDDGGTWALLDAGISQTRVQAMGISGSGTVFAGTRSDGVFRSTDAGATWGAVNTGLPASFDVTDFLFPPDGSVLVTLFAGVFRSRDDGDTWEATGTVPVFGVKAIARDSHGSLYIASRGGGIAISMDDAQSWTSSNSGLLHLDATSVLVDADDNVFAGTHGGGVFKSLRTVTSITPGGEDLLERFGLEQNYPNPFNPNGSLTTIRYKLLEHASVELTVMNTLGQIVRVLFSGRQAPGVYDTQWDGKDSNEAPASSGIYLYRLETAGYSHTRVMLLVR